MDCKINCPNQFVPDFFGQARDWSGFDLPPTAVPPAYNGDPNPIFMSDEPWFNEFQNSITGRYNREVGAICPKVIRFHPYKQKMFITGLTVGRDLGAREVDHILGYPDRDQFDSGVGVGRIERDCTFDAPPRTVLQGGMRAG